MSEDILFPPLGHPAAMDRESVGSKAAALSALVAAGFPVPAGFVVRESAFSADTTHSLNESLQMAVAAAGPANVPGHTKAPLHGGAAARRSG